MIKSKKLLPVAALFTLMALLFSGCFFDQPLTKEQKGWVKKMEKYYPDDTFTAEGHSVVSWGVRSMDCVSVSSKNYPGVEFDLYMDDGELYSNYPIYYHADAVDDYFCDMLTSYYGCDDVGIRNTDTAAKPLKYVDDDEYIEEYAIHHFISYLYYDDDHDYPDEDEIISMTIDYLSQVHADDDRGNLINLYFCRPGVKDPNKDADMMYQVSLHNGKVTIREMGDNNTIISGESLKSLLRSRK